MAIITFLSLLLHYTMATCPFWVMSAGKFLKFLREGTLHA